MASKFAPAIPVPDLHNKLSVLILHSLESYTALARRFRSKDEPNGITTKAIKNWVVGEGSRGPNHIPAERFEQMVKIVRDLLPDKRSLDDAKALFSAETAAPLQWCFVDHATRSDWYDLALNAPEMKDLAIIRLGELSMTTNGLPLFDPVDAHPFPINKNFRFDLNLGADYWTIVIQWSRAKGWVVLPSNRTEVVLPPSPNVSTFPERRLSLHDPVAHLTRYLFVRLTTPLPGGLEDKLKLSAFTPGTLETDTLGRLAHLINSSPKNSITKLDIDFFDPSGGTQSEAPTIE